MKTKNYIKTKHLVLFPSTSEEFRRYLEKTAQPEIKEHFEKLLSLYPAVNESIPRNTPWIIFSKKEKDPLGFISFRGAPQKGEAEIDLTLYHSENQERYAVEALKAVSKWAFMSDKKLMKIVTWFNRSLNTVFILEKAGFERTFESKGLTRYEKKRSTLSFLTLFIIVGTIGGAVLGKFLNNYPVCIALGICLGIFPGHFIDTLLKRRRK